MGNTNKHSMKLQIKARTYAQYSHSGKLDDEGKDYFEAHVEVVGFLVAQLTDDDDVIAAAYLHDVIEDTEIEYEEIVKDFNKRIADLVMEVTHEGCKDGYGYYFPRLKTKEGILIKLCDRASNVSRMDAWDKKRQQQYLNKTKFWNDGKDKK